MAEPQPDEVDRMQQRWSELMPDADFASLGVIHRLMRGARLVIERSDAALAASGLTRGELDVLSALYRSAAPLSPTALADQLLSPPPSITMRLKALESRGLLTREASPQDARSRPAGLTAAGRALVAEVIPAQLALETSLLDGTGVDAAALAAGLRRLTSAWEATR